MSGCRIDASAVFGHVLIDRSVALVVVAVAHEPREDAAGVRGVGDAGFRSLAVERGDVFARDRLPEHVGRVVDPSPSLDPGEETFDARPIAKDPKPCAFLVESGTVGAEDRNQVLGARKDEHIGFVGIKVLRQSTVGPARDGRVANAPAETIRTVTGTRVVGQR